MNQNSNKRRHFIKAGLTASVLANIPWKSAVANANLLNRFPLPEHVHAELYKIYGNLANNVVYTDRLILKAPAIAENGAVVPISVKGEKGVVSSLTIFAAENSNPFVCKFSLHEGADLAVSTRFKLKKTSDIYVVAQTKNGLVGITTQVKVTIGCGGG